MYLFCKGDVYMGDRITLKQFLKQYTAISNKFIEEYMKFYDLCAYTKYGIKLDNVIKYLGIKNSKAFYEKFRDKYTVNADYVIIIIKGKK